MTRSRQRFRRSARTLLGGTFGEDAVLVRQTAGTRVAGEWRAGTPVRSNVRLAAESVTMTGTPDEVRSMLPDGARLDSARLFMIPVDEAGKISPLRVGNVQTGPDVIEYRGHSYRLHAMVGDYAEFGHVEVIGLRPDRDRSSE